MVMKQKISKSQFKSRLLEYIRLVEKEKEPLIITHFGKPVAKLVSYTEEPVLNTLRRTVTQYKDPTEPIELENWEALQW